MKHALRAIFVTTAFVLLGAGGSPADAAGCLKGAAVGGVAGHMAGHGVLGAAGGCAVGHHMASKAERTSREQQSQQPPAPGGSHDHP